jgi:L-fuculokinase
MPQDLIAVLDVGKTNAKLILVEGESGETIWSIERRSTAVARFGFRELPVEGIERWLLAGLASTPRKKEIRAIVPVAHGAAAVLVSSTGKLIAAPDYEDPSFDTVAEPYRTARGPFEKTFSPFLPLGLNLGRQFFYLKEHEPQIWNAATAALSYPQYWAWRLSGLMSSEVTSLGCHSDLWLPLEGRYSALAEAQGWDKLVQPLRKAGDTLGAISNSVAQITGLDPSCRVLCGIHDSNASYLCHRVAHGSDQPFAVISSGTWTVIMAHGADLAALREDRDMLANVDALGTPVATARFMGGREYEAITGNKKDSRFPTPQALMRVLDKKAFAVPSFAAAGGPFAGRTGKLINTRGLDDAELGALATMYCVLQADLLLDLLGASGDVIVDGPFAKNPLYGAVLASVRPGSQVQLTKAIECRGFAGYHADWRNLAKIGPDFPP